MSLQKAGIYTRGIIWVVKDAILMLDTLCAGRLEFSLRKYLKTDLIFKNLTVAKKHLDIMAGSIVEAMEAGTPLQIAGADGSSEACGIFVGRHN